MTSCGRICFNRQKINLSVVFAGQSVGLKQVSEHIWLVSFMDYDLGYFDHETCRLEPLENPFGPKVLRWGRPADGVSSAHRVARAGFVYSHQVILSADKELFLQDRCRRSAGNGYRCRPDGPWREERIPDQ